MKLIPDDVWAILTIWQEARGEIQDGKVGVAEVIYNRAKAKYSSDGTISGTILKPYQFSGWNTLDSNRLKCANLEYDDPIILDCKEAWEDAKKGSRLTEGALLYYNPRTVHEPDWVDNCRLTAIIGKHYFYITKKL